MKRLLGCLLLLFGSYVWGAEPPKWLREVTVKTDHRIRQGDSTLIQNGTGTIVGTDDAGFEVLTCYHNFEEMNTLAFARGTVCVIDQDDVLYDARVVRQDRKRDLALLRITSKNRVAYARVASKETRKEGTAVLRYGFPAEGDWYEEGSVAGYRAWQQGYEMLPLVMPSSPGASGAGVFRAKDRKLIGVLNSGSGKNSSAVRLEEVRGFLGLD